MPRRTAPTTRGISKGKHPARAPAASKKASQPADEIGHVGENPNIILKLDVSIFERHRAMTVLGGKPDPVDKFPGGSSKSGYAYLLQRLSDYCYTVAAFCSDPSRGAEYTMASIPGKHLLQTVWDPPAACGLGGSLAPAAANLVDTVHLDLVNCKDGKTRLTKKALLKAVTKSTTHIFLNVLRDATAVAEAISQCGALNVVILIESSVSVDVVEALVAKGSSLRGVVLKDCYPDAMTQADDCWGRLFAAARDLRWFSASFLGGGFLSMAQFPIGPQSWDALPPSLHALSYTGNATTLIGERSGSRIGPIGAQPDSDTQAVKVAAARLPALKWLQTG
jgi:hypothetical protein